MTAPENVAAVAARQVEMLGNIAQHVNVAANAALAAEALLATIGKWGDVSPEAAGAVNRAQAHATMAAGHLKRIRTLTAEILADTKAAAEEPRT